MLSIVKELVVRAVIKFRARLARLAFGCRRGKDLHNLHSIFSFNVISLLTHATSTATGLTGVKRSICIIRLKTDTESEVSRAK